MTPHVLINIIFIIIITSVVIITYIKQIKIEKISFEIINILNKNVAFLSKLNKKNEIEELKNTLRLSSELQIILKISKADYISLFKYDFSTDQKIHFIVSLDRNGSVVHNTLLDSYALAEDIINSKNLITNFELTELKTPESKRISAIMNFRKVKKVYYRNFKNDINPNGLLVLSYADENYIIPEGDKFEIQRILETVSKLI